MSLMTLPPELHQAIISHLAYPDALSLKHSSRYFYTSVYTGVSLKIEWLIMRRQLHLECPSAGPCLLNSDRDFCRGSIRLLMARRRKHDECEYRVGGRGCVVMGSKSCEWKRNRRWKGLLRWMGSQNSNAKLTWNWKFEWKGELVAWVLALIVTCFWTR